MSSSPDSAPTTRTIRSSAAPTAHASSKAIPRLIKEYRALLKTPIDGIRCIADPTNLLSWFFVIDGPDAPLGTDGQLGNLNEGKFFGRLVFPQNYPFSPPNLYMDTPSYLFSVNEHICMTNTSPHPEAWTSSWTAGSILNSVRMFFLVRLTQSINYASTAQRDQIYKDISYFVKATKFTTFRINQFRLVFPNVAQKFKVEIKAQAAEYLLQHGLADQGPDKDTQASTGPGGDDADHPATTKLPPWNGTIDDDIVTSLSGFDHFTAGEQIYLKALLNNLPIYAREPSKWFLQRNWLLFLSLIVVLLAVVLLDLFG